jgi:hypothetical protein
VVAGLAVETLGVSRVDVARATGVSRQAAAQAFERYSALPEERQERFRHLLDVNLSGL